MAITGRIHQHTLTPGGPLSILLSIGIIVSALSTAAQQDEFGYHSEVLTSKEAREANSITTVTLLTGHIVERSMNKDSEDEVRVYPPAGASSSADFETVVDGDNTYVIPAEVRRSVPDVLDPELFNISKLADLDLYDAASDVIPVRIIGQEAVEAAQGLPQFELASPPEQATGADFNFSRTPEGVSLSDLAGEVEQLISAADRVELNANGSSALGGTFDETRSDPAPNDDELANLEITGIGRDGEAARGQLFVMNVEDRNAYSSWPTFDEGSIELEVPPGAYSLTGLIETRDDSDTLIERVIIADPEIDISADTEVTIDARDSVPFEVEVVDGSDISRNSLGYHRTPAEGSSFTFDGTFDDVPSYITPTSEDVELGEFEAFGKWRHYAHEMFARVASDNAEIEFDYATRTELILAGETVAEVVDAGQGTEDDFAELELDGEIALMEAGGDDIREVDKAENAEDAGAGYALIYNSEPGMAHANVFDRGITTFVTTQEDGHLLLDELEADTLELVLDYQPTPYWYDLFEYANGVVPDDMSFEVEDDDLAALHSTVHADDEMAQTTDFRHVRRPYTEVATAGGRTIYIPWERLEYVSAHPDTRWNRYVTHDAARMDEPSGSYEGGSEAVVSWLDSPSRPPLHESDPVIRDEDTLLLRVPSWGDGHVGERRHNGSRYHADDEAEFHLYEDDELIADGGQAIGEFDLSADPHRYSLEVDVERDSESWQTSVSHSSVYGFASQGTTRDEVEYLPIMLADYHLDVDFHNGRPSVPMDLEFDVYHQDGLEDPPDIGSMVVRTSIDDGETWGEHDAEPLGDGEFRVSELDAEADVGDYVSVSIVAEDAYGNSLEQYVMRAWVVRSADELKMDPDALDIRVGEEVSVNALAGYVGGVTLDVADYAQLSVDDNQVASVDEAGNVTAVGPGEALLTGEFENQTATAHIKVAEPVLESVEVRPGSAELVSGDDHQFSAWAVYDDGSEDEVTEDTDWSSSDDEVVTVDHNGLASAVGEGQADVTAGYEGSTGTAAVAVSDDLPPEDPVLGSVVVAPDEATVAVDGTVQLEATAVYEDDSEVDVTEDAEWASDDTDVATVDDAGLVSGVAEGAAEVTAAFDELSDSATVTVDPEVEPGPVGLERISAEPGRVEVAIAASEHRFDDGEADAVMLARADEYPDALAGTTLAAEHNAPLLLTSSDVLLDNVADEITRVLGDDGQVFLAGGTEALDETVEQAADDLGYELTRLGGETRFETAGLIADALGDRSQVLITTGLDFPDALTAGAAAAPNDGVVLLSAGDDTHDVVDDYLDAFDGDQAWAVGGPATRAYPDAEPVMGETRDETAVAVAEAFFDQPVAFGVSRRDDYPDALSGGAHIAAHRGPLLLSYTNDVPEETAQWLTDTTATGGFVYGGTHAINENTYNELEALTFDDNN